MDPRPIGVFDSGVGGLTIVRALIDLLPGEEIIYFGDTARYPYGTRSREEVRSFSLQIGSWLASEGIKMLVVACNSASSAGLDHIRSALGGMPIAEVVDPAVRAAVRATRSGKIGVIGTALTVSSGAYDRAVAETKENVEFVSAACPRFVEFVERGETAGPQVIAVAREYLAPLAAAGVDTLILGCTHYPLLAGVIKFVMGPRVTLISSADETARDVYAELTRRDMLRAGAPPSHRFLSSGDAATFEALGARFLGPELAGVREQQLGREMAR